ncbi:GPI inositol-deacylase [Psychrobacter phenylpyruvicus]|uniref:Uncharacterized protein with an alpha/beta hydrolase fold n=2 Tax=Psychrobacter phenylpyruvicus TaxID=29432 RepID=A0A379LM43_9GAMM|nr:GPI inositol-deacylase [Psychrobacter phenylpyruvicus]SUD91511.1 Uncharacterized protein with an alpha/beta hydrolase fold [Psychrobacter phenylpyruvicus]
MTQTTASDCKAKSNNEPLVSETLSVYDFLAGISQLSIIGVIETTAIVEAIHREVVLRPIGLLNHKYDRVWRHSISSRVYGMVRGITLLVGHGLAFAMHKSKHFLGPKSAQPLPNKLHQVVDVLNGVMGDHLESKQNPLALPMMLYNSEGRPIAKSNQASQPRGLSGKVVIVLHGLCMGYINWQPTNEQGLGQRIVKALPDTSVLYLNYNTGRRISTNGRELSALLQQLNAAHPDISEITLIGHSMGGLVSRSALYYGEQAQQQWVKKTKKLITLGAPHHGAVLERIGNTVQQTISKLPFAGSLGKLGDIRSTGIIDLRHGSIRDEDWQSLATRSVLPDSERHFTPLPEHIAAYFLAASLSEEGDNSKVNYMLGDGLVNIHSALGEHIGDHSLDVPKSRKVVVYGIGHLALLSDKRVLDQTIKWLQEEL